MSKALTMEINDKGIVLDGVLSWPFDSMREEPYGYKIWLGDYPVEVKEGEEPKIRKAPTLMVYPKKGEPGIYEISADMKFTVDGKPVEPSAYMITAMPGMEPSVDLWTTEKSKVKEFDENGKEVEKEVETSKHAKGKVEFGKGKPSKPGKFETPKDEPIEDGA